MEIRNILTACGLKVKQFNKVMDSGEDPYELIED